MRRSNKLIKSSVCHDVHAPTLDILNNGWHNGWRKPDSQTVAFFYKKQWWASITGNLKVQGPFKDKQAALDATLENTK